MTTIHCDVRAKTAGTPNENIDQNDLNIALYHLLDVRKS